MKHDFEYDSIKLDLETSFQHVFICKRCSVKYIYKSWIRGFLNKEYDGVINGIHENIAHGVPGVEKDCNNQIIMDVHGT